MNVRNFLLPRFILLLAWPFLAASIHAATISGTVKTLDGAGIINAEVRLTGSATALVITDATGAYSFPGLVDASYTVTTTKAGLVFTPSSRSYASLPFDQTNQDFTYGKEWTGAGGNSLASNPANWTGNEIPAVNDVIRFDASAGAQGCLWNVERSLNSLELAVGFSTSVTAAVEMDIGTLTIGAGEANFNSQEIRISTNFIHTAGKFTWGPDGTVIWNGSTVQTVSMVKTSLGGNLYESYFFNFRVAGSSTVRPTGDLVIDGLFSISSGRFEAGTATHTLTGRSQGGAVAPSENLVWHDAGGTFVSGGGKVLFYGTGDTMRISQGNGNAFANVSIVGGGVVAPLSDLAVNGNLSLGDASTTVRLDLGDDYTHAFNGPVLIGPTSSAASTAFAVGRSTVNFANTVSVGTATLTLAGGRLAVKGTHLEIGSQATLSLQSPGTCRVVFDHQSRFKLNGGTLLNQGSAVFTSSAPGQARYAMDINGTVNLPSAAIFESMNADGFRLGAGANPVQMESMDFRLGPTGGAGLNFDPVSVSAVSIGKPQFDATISTNVRAILDAQVIGASSIQITEAGGAHAAPSYEYDPSSIVHWGTIGTPTGFTGTAISIEKIQWGWTPVNKPLGFLVQDGVGGTVSPTLTLSTTYWAETGLSTNTAYTRVVRAFTDSATADSASRTRYTLAASPTSAAIDNVGHSSITVSWQANQNPAATVFTIERSTTSGSGFSQISSGTLAQICPYTDAGLQSRTTYYYRIRAYNGDGVVAASAVTASTVTVPIPPPVVSSVSPMAAENLSVAEFSITGSNFQSGSTAVLKTGTTRFVGAEIVEMISSGNMTASFNVTGLEPGSWDIRVENPDGGLSSSSAGSQITISQAASTSQVAIGSFSTGLGLTLAAGGGNTALAMSAGAMANARVYLSVDPENQPLEIDSDTIASANANAALSGLYSVPNTLREINAYVSTGRHTSGFGAPVTLSIAYPDANDDGIVDGLDLRAGTLRVLTIDESSGVWEPVAGSTVDLAAKRVTALLHHFSVYGLFGSNTSADLGNVRLYPSPWKPGSGGAFDASVLTIDNLTETGTVRIYSLDASLVRELAFGTLNAGVVTWDGRTADGSDAVSGVYLVYIESATGVKRTIKFGIER